MSLSRCGLSVNRNTTITRDYQDWPRWKQMNCQIEGISDYHFYKTKQEEQKSAPVVLDEMQIAETSDLTKKEQQISSIVKGVESLVEQKGSGFRSRLSQILADVSNKFPDSDKNARPISPGEHHQLLKLRNNRFGRSNYSGPGTLVAKRVRRRDPPRTEVDKVAQAHDIRYALSRGENTEQSVREADTKMIDKLNEIQKNKTDSRFNIIPAKLAISAKIKAEDFGVLSRKKFISDKSPNRSDKILLERKLKELEQEGYGDIPGQKLLKKYQRKVKNKRLGKKSKLPVYTSELEISNMLADKLLPMVIS
ncbi:MAG: hypothetical protein HRT87_10835 [Legionellales bacterium]|nr:hypothetical protein [Legionellales bacterium]